MSRFNARDWVEGEIQDQIDGYGNTEWQAAQFVRDLLNDDEYRDALNDRQRESALKYIRERMDSTVDSEV